MNTQDNNITRENLGRLAENHVEVKLVYGQECSRNLRGQVHLGADLKSGENISPTAYYFVPSNGEIQEPIILRADHLSALLVKGEKGLIRIDHLYSPFNGGKNGRT